MASITLKVGGMSCMGCVGSVKRLLEQVPGVASAEVDLAGATATVTYDPERVQPAALRQAVIDGGYTVAD